MAVGRGASQVLLTLLLLSMTICENHPAHSPTLLCRIETHVTKRKDGAVSLRGGAGRWQFGQVMDRLTSVAPAPLRLRGGLLGLDQEKVTAALKATQSLMIPDLVNYLQKALESKDSRHAELASWLDMLLRGQEGLEEDPKHPVWKDQGFVPVHVMKRIAELDTGIKEPQHGWEAGWAWREEVMKRHEGGTNMTREEEWRFMFGLIEDYQRYLNAIVNETDDGRIRFGPPSAEEKIRPFNQTILAELCAEEVNDNAAARQVVAEIEEERERGEGRFLSARDTELMEAYVLNKTGWVCPKGIRVPFPPPRPGEPFPEVPKVPNEYLETLASILHEIDKASERGHVWDGVDHNSLNGFERGVRSQFANWPVQRLFEPLFPDPPEPETLHLQHTHDFDRNGVFYHLGSRHTPVHPMYEHGWEPEDRPEPHDEWINPAKSGRVRVLCGAAGADGGCVAGAALLSREDVLEREIDTVGDTFFFRDGWFCVDLGNGTRVKPTAYTVRQGGRGRVMVSWLFEASNDEAGPWVVLDEHRRDAVMLDGVWGESGKNERFSKTFVVCGHGQGGGTSDLQGSARGGGTLGRDDDADDVMTRDDDVMTRDDDVMTRDDDVMTRDDDAHHGYFRYLKIRQVENDADPEDPSHEPGWMWLQGFEVYGTLMVS